MSYLFYCVIIPYMNNLKKNEIYTVEISGYSSESYGVCRIDGQAVFVPRALKGERWEIRIVKVLSSSAYARGEKLLVPSPHRLEPKCPYFTKCGGCDTWHMDYDEELRFKLDRVNSALTHIGKQTVTASEIAGSALTERYRNKAIFAIGDLEGKPGCGFYRERSHELTHISSCLIQSELSCRAAAAVCEFMEVNHIPAYDEKKRSGLVRHVFCRQAINGKDAVACIVATGGFGTKTGALTAHLRALCPELTGIVLNVNKKAGNTVLSGDFYTLWGNANVRDSLCDLNFEIAPQAFFQINPPQAEKLYNKAVEYAFSKPAKLVFDLYCGAGTISLCLARRAERVIGAEIVPQAVENAAENAARNGISNAEFICADAAKAAQKLAMRGLKPDVIVTDPPRKGMDEAAIESVASMQPDRIVYVSCNPATLARDILRFNAHGYTLKQASAVDMFPKTCHVETVVLMSRAKE